MHAGPLPQHMQQYRPVKGSTIARHNGFLTREHKPHGYELPFFDSYGACCQLQQPVTVTGAQHPLSLNTMAATCQL
jgi:hypothetical protein